MLSDMPVFCKRLHCLLAERTCSAGLTPSSAERRPIS